MALTLREVCGLTTEEIAAAYLSKPAAIAQRIVRAKKRIRDENLPYEVPAARRVARPARYACCTPSISSSTKATTPRAAMPSSAASSATKPSASRACSRNCTRTPDSDGLLALMLLHQSRAATRQDAQRRDHPARRSGPRHLEPRSHRRRHRAGPARLRLTAGRRLHHPGA